MVARYEADIDSCPGHERMDEVGGDAVVTGDVPGDEEQFDFSSMDLIGKYLFKVDDRVV